MHSFSGNRFEDQTTACPSFSYSKHNFSLQEMFLITFYLPSQHTCKRCDHDIHPILLCKRIYICMHRYRLSLAIVENPAPEKRRTINSQSAVHLYSCCRGSPWSYMLRRWKGKPRSLLNFTKGKERRCDQNAFGHQLNNRTKENMPWSRSLSLVVVTHTRAVLLQIEDRCRLAFSWAGFPWVAMILLVRLPGTYIV